MVLSSRLLLRPVSAAAHGSAYLLTHLSWTSRIGTGFRKWSFSRPRRLVHLEVLHHAEARHGEALLERRQRLPVLPEELIEQAAARGVCERPEHFVHGGDHR
jgi:hypothetical protein